MKVPFINDAFFSRLETSSLELRSSLAGFFGGKHLVKTYGQTVEFADYREYMLGDDIRRIDWNLYSRFEKYFLKLFTDERQMHTQIFLDCSASMGKVEQSKAQYALGFAAALGFLSVQNMDKLSFKLINGDGAQDPFGKIVGKTNFFRVVGDLEKVEFDGESDISSAIIGCADIGTNDGLTVIISDFFTEADWKKAVDFLLYKRRQVMLIQVLTREEMEPAYYGRINLLDSEAMAVEDSKNMRLRITRSLQAAYDEAIHDFIADIGSFCSRRDVGFITSVTDSPIEKEIFGKLLKSGIMQ